MTPAPKPVRIKSKALTNSAKGRECTLRGEWCGSLGEAAVFCHIRLPGNAGVATKPPDFFGVFACGWCHSKQEARGHFSDGDLLRAISETQYLMWQAGLLYTKGAAPK